MWDDHIKRRFRWATIHNELDELIYELVKAEEEEEVGLYLLRLHYNNEIDMAFFTKSERERIRKILTFLIKETEKHRDLLLEVTEELEEKRRTHAGSGV